MAPGARAAEEAGESDEGWALFEEPAGFRPATPPPTEVVQTLAHGEAVRLRLVGSHPLWGHYVWNAAPTLAHYLAAQADAYVRGQHVLELGAAAGLPSIAADRAGAARVVATDYPDPDLMQNLAHNLATNASARAVAHGYVWGADPCLLRAEAPHGYDTILMSDLIFNHQAHPALLATCDACLAPGGRVLVFFSHHRPHMAEKDVHFFTLARARGYHSYKIRDWRLEVCGHRKERTKEQH